MKNRLVLVAVFLTATATADQQVDFRPLTQSCEESLALSAMPKELRERATVYVWRDGEFHKTVDSDGGFHCLVQRNHPDSIIPQCVSSNGEASILEGIIAQTKLVADGMSATEAAERTEEMIERGDLGVPDEPGVNYMMSAYNRIFSARADSIVHVGPHSMFFAPYVSAEILGASFPMSQAIKGYPAVVEAGGHGYIITFTDRSSASDDVEKHCKDQIDLEG